MKRRGVKNKTNSEKASDGVKSGDASFSLFTTGLDWTAVDCAQQEIGKGKERDRQFIISDWIP